MRHFTSLSVLLTMAACANDPAPDGSPDMDPAPEAPEPAVQPVAEPAPEPAPQPAPEPAPVPSFDSINAYAKGRVAAAACLPGLQQLFTPLMHSHFSPTDAQLACLADLTTGCAGVEACMDMALDREAEACTDGCDGDVLTRCAGPMRLETDCAAFGLSCHAGACVQLTGEACDDDTPEVCWEGRATRCEEGREIASVDCARVGLICAADDFDGAYCHGNGDVVTDGGISFDRVDFRDVLACEDDTVTVVLGSLSHHVACSAIHPDLTCQAAPCEGEDCVGFCGVAGECDPTNQVQPPCDGDVAKTCVAGRLERVDCVALGFSGCARGACTE